MVGMQQIKKKKFCARHCAKCFTNSRLTINNYEVGSVMPLYIDKGKWDKTD